MQLKTIGESLNVTNRIRQVINANSHLGNGLNDTIVLENKLAEATTCYSTEAIKVSIAESTLNETQIKAILYKKGLTGETLETTAAELAQVTSTNALSASQETATASTIGFGNAMKGLGASIKNLVASHPAITALIGAIATVAASSAVVLSIIDATTTSYSELRE